MKYNERIKEIREDHSYTQQQVADWLNVRQRTYCDYESGKTRIPIDSIIILAQHYNVSMDYITGVSNQKGHFPSNQSVNKKHPQSEGSNSR
ncbi:MAG: helix-turn-helix transcriptional regulator [Suilimivivens sp.]